MATLGLPSQSASNSWQCDETNMPSWAYDAALPPTTDYRVSIVNAKGAGAYPISSFTWIILYEKQADAAKGKKLVDFLRWALSDEGQGMEAALDYAPLPASMRTSLLARLDSVK